MEMRHMSCCGLTEISGISDINYGGTLAGCFYRLATRYVQNPTRGSYFQKGGIIFTQAAVKKETKGYGYKFADYIVENKLGTISILPEFKNPNTYNSITTFLWVPNNAGIRAHVKKLSKNPPAR